MILISNKKYTLYAEGRIEIYNPNLANKINKVLKYYPEYRFTAQKADEPIFKFGPQNKLEIYKILGYKG
jgi:hypothetical protein